MTSEGCETLEVEMTTSDDMYASSEHRETLEVLVRFSDDVGILKLPNLWKNWENYSKN